MSSAPNMDFSVELNQSPTPEEVRSELFKDLGFGRVFSDHMVTIEWCQDQGWHNPRITARRPFQLDPASAVLHYAQEIFEGMKAYRADNDRIVLFRPEENARRFANSAIRMGMPVLPEELFLSSISKLTRVDEKWVPSADGSLYLRPFMFSQESFLGVRPAKNYIYCVIASPVGSYFKGGEKPVTLWVSEQFSRAGPGGTGTAKCGGNYAASLAAQSEAIAKGCDQVVFLDSNEKKWVEELGGMNIFFVMKNGSLITPPLNGNILPGITRDSILSLASARGLTTHERPYSFDEWKADASSGQLAGAFACGTAAVITQIGSVRYATGEFSVPTEGFGADIIRELKAELIGIQKGLVSDVHGWVREV